MPSCRSARRRSALIRRSSDGVMLQTIGELLERNARFHPEREALVCEGRRLSHRQLLERAKRLADGLHRLGLRRQDRVAILSMNNAEYIELLAAGDWAGYIVATVNFRLAAAEIEWLLGDATPRVLVFEAQYAETGRRAAAAAPDDRGLCVHRRACAGLGAATTRPWSSRAPPRGRRSARRRRTTGRWSIPAAPPAGPRARCAPSGAGCARPTPARRERAQLRHAHAADDAGLPRRRDRLCAAGRTGVPARWCCTAASMRRT